MRTPRPIALAAVILITACNRTPPATETPRDTADRPAQIREASTLQGDRAGDDGPDATPAQIGDEPVYRPPPSLSPSPPAAARAEPTSPPPSPDTPPPGATARCRDGAYTRADRRAAVCAGHKGLERWLPG